jgi:hypothetical protein
MDISYSKCRLQPEIVLQCILNHYPLPLPSPELCTILYKELCALSGACCWMHKHRYDDGESTGNVVGGVEVSLLPPFADSIYPTTSRQVVKSGSETKLGDGQSTLGC